MNLVNKPLRIYHMAQVPCSPFIVEVKDEIEASWITNILAQQHLFLERENIIPDYSNTMGVQMFEDNEWVDYYNDSEFMEWDEFEETYLRNEHSPVISYEF